MSVKVVRTSAVRDHYVGGRPGALEGPAKPALMPESPSGEVLAPSMKVESMERFWQKVEKTERCWLWRGAVDNNGYGRFRLNGKTVYAHRLAYKLSVHSIETDMTLDHLCRNRQCVNPDHLEQVTNKENILRGQAPSAKAARRTTCLNGHVYDDANTYWRKNGQRVCRVCHRDEMRRTRRHV